MIESLNRSLNIFKYLTFNLDEEMPEKRFQIFFLKDFFADRPDFEIDLRPETNYFLMVP